MYCVLFNKQYIVDQTISINKKYAIVGNMKLRLQPIAMFKVLILMIFSCKSTVRTEIIYFIKSIIT